jgi:hypothetical protein
MLQQYCCICNATELMTFMFLSVVEDNSYLLNGPTDRSVQVSVLSDWVLISNQFLARGLLITLMMEAVSTSETLVNFYQTTLRNI